jgi:radical SAM superfamily enzyme YgiQ (UPF0313 family)
MPDIVLTTINAKWIHPSVALRLLKANLREFEDTAVIVEFALRQPLTEKVETLLQFHPKILGFSVSIWNHLATVALLTELFKHWSGQDRPIIVLGGPEVSYLSADAELIHFTDWVIKGEGENCFRELCRVLLLHEPWEEQCSIQKVAGKFVYALPVDLDLIDPAYRLYTDEDLARKYIYVESSRGCPFGCEFCLSSLDTSVRYFSLEPFITEMEKLIQRGARNFKFLDRTFNLDYERARTIMSFFLEHLPPDGCVHFEMVPARFSDTLCDLIKQFPPGSLRLEVGIQTLNPVVAHTIHRPADPAKELETLQFLHCNTRALVHADLIAGLPGEDYASFARGFDLLWGTRPAEIQVGILKKLPGAPIARHDDVYAMVYNSEPPYEVIQTSTMTRSELDDIKNFARFWEILVNRGKFDDLLLPKLPADNGCFVYFMLLSKKLLTISGRNWGIDQNALRKVLQEIL